MVLALIRRHVVQGKVRILGVESGTKDAPTEGAPTAVHLALAHDVCFPAMTALAAGNEVARQALDSTSVLRSDPLGATVEAVKVRECAGDDSADGGKGVNLRDSSMSLSSISRCCVAKVDCLWKQEQAIMMRQHRWDT